MRLRRCVRDLRSIGIQPDILLCRTDRVLPRDVKQKIALFCDVDEEAVITARDVDTITIRETVKDVRESEDWIAALIPAGAGLLAAVRR